jgi:hypothetical protein
MTPAEEEVEVIHATDDELRVGVRRMLREFGLTADELREQGRTGEFESEDARFAWFCLSRFLDLA